MKKKTKRDEEWPVEIMRNGVMRRLSKKRAAAWLKHIKAQGDANLKAKPTNAR